MHGMLLYAPEIQQLYFGDCFCPEMEVIRVFFTPGIDSLNEAVRSINEGPLLFPEDGRELYGTGAYPEMQQLYFRGFSCPQNAALCMYFTRGIMRWNGANRSVTRG